MIVAPEALPTFFTLMSLLTWKNTQSLHEQEVCAFLSVCEDETTLTGVYFLMFGQVVVADEGFSTLVTLVTLVIVVDSEVEPDEGTEVKCFSDILLKIKVTPNQRTDSLDQPHTCRSCCGENFDHKCCRGEASPRCGSSGAPLTLS